jgi:hypothetical protein
LAQRIRVETFLDRARQGQQADQALVIAPRLFGIARFDGAQDLGRQMVQQEGFEIFIGRVQHAT